jgi:arylsulfatase A-like enzyme
MKNSILFLLLSSSLTAGTIIQFGGDEGIIADSNHISQIGGGTQIDQIIDWLGNSSAGGSASGILGGGTSSLPGAVLTSETYGLTLTSVSVAGTGATGTRSNGNPNVLGVDAVDAAKFDSSSGDTWTFEFDEDVKLRQLVFSALNYNGETVKITGAASASFTRLDTNMAAVTYGADASNRYVYTFPTPVDISAGTDITLESTQGSWGLQGVVVEFDYQPPAPVDPDPFEPNPDGGVEPTAQTPLRPAPNVIIFIADDMGIGDSSAYQDLTGNADAVQIDTPEMERLADMGTRFTDVHTNAATCTPTRIALLSGTYSLRSPLKTAAANTTHINGVIMPGKRTTIAHMMQRSGYASYGYGKWHLAMKGDAGTDADDDGVFEVQSAGILYEGPIEMGFDTYTGTPGNFSYTGAMIQDRQFMRFNNAAPSDYTLVPVNDPSNVPWDGRGPSSPTDPNLFKIQPATFEKLQADLTGHIANKGDQPFFIYYASHSNHDPYVPANFDSTTDPDNPTASLNGITITPNITKAGAPIPIVTGPDLNGDGIPDPDYGANPDWIWSDPLREKWWDHVTFMNAADTAITVNGPTSRAMMVRENDIIVGYMLDFLEATDDPRNPGYKLIDNTIFIFTSDNGSDIKSEAAAGAMPAASDILNPANYDVNGKILPSVPKQDIRAFKGTRFEGGSRVPFIASWPDPGDPLQTNGIPAGKTSPAVFGLQDVYATIAEAIGHQLHEQEAVDSESLLTAWTDPLQNTVDVRTTDMLSKYQRFVFSRRGQLKLAAEDASFPGSLANNTQGNNDRFANDSTLDFLDMDHVDLFDLEADLPETTDTDPSGSSGDATSMLTDMQTYLTQGYSRAGAAAFENGVNFIGGDLLTDANWHAYKTSRNGIAAGSTTPGIIAIDGTATGNLVNRTYVHRAGTITYTPSSGGLSGSLYELDGGTLNVDESLRMANSRLEVFRGSVVIGANDLELNGTNCVVIVSGGDINAANLSVGEAGASAGFKIVRFKGGAGSVTLTGGVSFGDDGDSTNDFIDFVSGSRGRLVSPAGTINYASLWNMGQLRIDGVAGGTGGFTTSAFKVITLGDGNEALVLADGDQIVTFDYDDDRISDVWEQDTVGGMDLLSMTSDYDGDGILDIEEYILDFDPTSPDSPFAASIIWNSGNSVDIRFGSKASRNYLVQFTSDLTASEWMTLNYEVGTDGVFNFNDDPQGSTRGFYKVQVFLP